MLKENVCVLCGERPGRLPETLHWDMLERRIEQAIRSSIFSGYDTFYLGMALGVDIRCCEILLGIREEFPYIKVHAFPPCQTQAGGWQRAWRARYHAALEKCDRVYFQQSRYTSGCVYSRSRRMVDGASRLIAVCGGEPHGEVGFTLRYARRQRLGIIQIDPWEYKTAELM